MEKKKLRLTISGSSKKTKDKIELAKAKEKNSVVIGKKIDLVQKLRFQKLELKEIHTINQKVILFLEKPHSPNHL